MFFVTDAWAQGATAAGAPASGSPMDQILGRFVGSGASPLVMFGLMFAIMYFLLIRPQSQEKKKLEAAIEKLQKGDKVLTTSGMVATVVSIDKTRALLRISEDVKVEFVRSAIAQVLPVEKS